MKRHDHVCRECLTILGKKKWQLPGKGVCLNDRCKLYGLPQFGLWT